MSIVNWPINNPVQIPIQKPGAARPQYRESVESDNKAVAEAIFNKFEVRMRHFFGDASQHSKLLHISMPQGNVYIWNTNFQTEAQARREMYSDRLSGDRRADVKLCFVQPGLVALKDMSGQSTAE